MLIKEQKIYLGQLFFQKYFTSEKVYNGFVELFNDKNPLHTDEDFARQYGFNSKVMHGNILNGYLSHFIGECLPFKNLIIHTQNIQYKQPVYLNNELELKATVAEIHESVSAIEFKFVFVNTDDKIVARGRFQIGILS